MLLYAYQRLLSQFNIHWLYEHHEACVPLKFGHLTQGTIIDQFYYYYDVDNGFTLYIYTKKMFLLAQVSHPAKVYMLCNDNNYDAR